MIRRPPRSTQSRSSAASDVYKRQPLADELDELRVLLRRVFQVGILDHHQLAANLLEPAPERGALALVACLEHQLEPQFPLQTGQDLLRPILRPVVHDDQLGSNLDGEHAPDDLLHRLTLVVHGHDDRQQGIDEDAAKACGSQPHASRSWYPWGCASNHRHAVSMIMSKSANRGTQPSSAWILVLAAYNTAGSPARRGAIAWGTWRPVTRATDCSTSLTENGCL